LINTYQSSAASLLSSSLHLFVLSVAIKKVD
jgi:hypothetical protein